MKKNLHKILTKNAKETQEIGFDFAKEALSLKSKTNAALIGLEGNLGAGKTTFLQGFARGLGIKEKILSPTFVIMKRFKMPPGGNFFHIDCYRLNSPEEILEIGFEDIIKNPKNIVAIEWPEKIEKFLPKNAIIIKFRFVEKEKREIVFVVSDNKV